MNRTELRDAVRRGAFSSDDNSEIDRWVSLADSQCWLLEDWLWKYVQKDVSVTAGSSTVGNVGSDVEVPLGLWDSNGDRLQYMSPERWLSCFYAETTQGQPWAYTNINGVLLVGPPPSESSSLYRLLYQRKYGHLASGGTYTVGPMDSDTDTPVMPSELHYVLVHWARMIGKAMRTDPTAKLEEDLRNEALDAMRRSWLADRRGQYGQWGSYDPETFVYAD